MNRELALCKSAFNLARLWKWSQSNPFTLVRFEKEQGRERVLSHGEEDRLLEVCQEWLREIVIFALDTGCREGEILNLEWLDIDMEDRVITVLQGKTGYPKVIPMTERVYGLLCSEVERAGLVFPTSNSTPFSASNMLRSFRIACNKSGISGLRFHDLRHTYASRLVRAGVDIYTVGKLLGHRSPLTTSRYAHHSLDSLRSATKLLVQTKGRRSSVVEQVIRNH